MKSSRAKEIKEKLFSAMYADNHTAFQKKLLMELEQFKNAYRRTKTAYKKAPKSDQPKRTL